jgi:hypothetical protein
VSERVIHEWYDEYVKGLEDYSESTSGDVKSDAAYLPQSL